MDNSNPQSDNMDRGVTQGVFEQAVEVLGGRKKGEPADDSVFDVTGNPVNTPPDPSSDAVRDVTGRTLDAPTHGHGGTGQEDAVDEDTGSPGR